MRRFTIRTWLNVGLAIVVIGVLAGATDAVAATKGGTKAGARTATVQRGSVLSTVTASGNVQSATNLSVNFATSGTLTEVDVVPGQVVTQGQVLAKIDPTTAQGALDEANANLQAAQLKLSSAQSEGTGSTTTSSVDVALNNAKSQQAFDSQQTKAAVEFAQSQLNSDQKTLATDNAALVTAQAGGDATTIALAQQQVNNDNSFVSRDQATLSAAQSNQNSIAQRDAENVSSASSSGASSSFSSSTSATSADSQAADVATAQGSVDQAQAQVTAAQKALGETTLTAPSNGTIQTVNGSVGDTVDGGSGSSSSSSTSSSGSGTGTTGGGSTGSSSSSSSGSSSAFITLTDLGNLEVKAGFTESDVTKLQVGQPATVSFDAVANSNVSGTVLSIDSSSTVVSNVVTYNAYISVIAPPTGIRPGMSANVAVTVDSRDNVLHVPTTALTGNTVTVIQNGKPVVTPVQVGLRGDDSVEITSGVTEGETVQLTSTAAAVTASSRSTTARTGAGATGFGGAGFGGGGGGFTGAGRGG